MLKHLSWLVVFPLLLASGRACTAADTGQTNDGPLVWTKPAKMPEFESRLHGKDYQQRLAPAVREIGDIEKLVASARPAVAVRVTVVGADSQADHLGIAVDDLLLTIDHHPLWAVPSPLHLLHATQSLVYVDGHGTRRTATIEPGPLGVEGRLEWHPEQLYLHGPQRNAKWDQLALVGISECRIDPDLAETAWRKAVSAGYRPDYLSAYCGAEIAMAQGRSEQAADFAWFAAQAKEEKGELVPPQTLYRALIANYKLAAAAEIVSRNPGVFKVNPDTLLELAGMHRHRPKVQRTVPAPSKMAEIMYRRDLTSTVVPACQHSRVTYPDLIAHREPLKRPVTNNEYVDLTYAPLEPVRDAEMVVRFRFHANGEGEGEHGNNIQVRIKGDSPKMKRPWSFDLSDQDWAPDVLLGATIKPKSPNVSLMHSNEPETTFSFDDPRVRPDGTTECEVRLIRVGGEGEIFLNGRRVAYVPVSEEIKQVWFQVHVVGVNIDIEPIQFTELIQPADAITALKAFDEAPDYRGGDPAALQADGLAEIASMPGTSASDAALADAATSLAKKAADNDRYKLSLRLLSIASAAANKATDQQLAARVDQLERRVTATKNEFEGLEPNVETLDRNSADPDANFAMGRFLCLWKGSWEEGLPMLALGKDGPLKSLAARETGAPTNAAARVAIADGWWDLGEQESGIARDSLRHHAADIYQAVLPSLASDSKKATIEKRLTEIGDLNPAAAVVVHAEAGDGTPAFKFPSIEPPSNRDYADESERHASIRVLRGALAHGSAPVAVLLDGHGQSKADSPKESCVFEDDTSGMILLDLGRPVSIEKINTYSWHPGERAAQKYDLYGSTNAQPPRVKGQLAANGWMLIARVDTDKSFGVPRVARPQQQGVSITSLGGSIGSFRFLLWDVRPIRSERAPVGMNTLFGEFDVVAK